MGTLLLIHLLSLPPGVGGKYYTEEALETLRCVRDWGELCDVRAYPGWQVYVDPDQVLVRPRGTPGDVVLFKVINSTPEALELVATHAGKRLTATISIRGRRLTWSGVDVDALMYSRKVEQVVTNLVKVERVNKLWAEAERRVVPGGQCTLLMLVDRPEEGPCLNTGTGLPETIDVEEPE